jgi:hypothetical protein
MLQSVACRDTVSFSLVFMFMPAVPTAAAHCPHRCSFIEVATQVCPPRSRDHSAHSGLDEGECERGRRLSEYTVSDPYIDLAYQGAIDHHPQLMAVSNICDSATRPSFDQ